MTRGVELEGRGVLVTGASSGIGRALAVRLAARGARLAVSARRARLLDELADQVDRDHGVRPAVLPADLGEPGAAAALAAQATEALGGVDVLVNNAGAGLVGPVPDLGDGPAARAALETNLWSPLALVAALAPAMRESGQPAAIVNVTSTIQAVPVPLLGYYAGSKAALAQLTRALRHECAGTAVRVVEVVPGATDTPARDVDLLPWRGSPPRTPPPADPEVTAKAIVRGLERGSELIVHPPTSLAPLELPAVGRLVARLAARRLVPIAWGGARGPDA